MNKNLLNQLPAKDQPIAAKLNSLVDDMRLSQTFQWELETQLMEKAKDTTPPAQGWFTKIMIPVGWALLAGCAIFLLSWTIRSLIPRQPIAAGATPNPETSFEDKVRKGDICTGPLALAHGFDVFLTNPDKTEFVTVDAGKAIGELRSFAWSPDGRQLAIVGNTTGRGKIYITHPVGGPLEDLFPSAELGYVMDAAWSRDEKQFVLWSAQNNKMVSLLNVDGPGLVEKPLEIMILSTPQFAPDGQSIVFYGADSSSAGLFEVRLDNSQAKIISALVEDETGFAFSTDGSQLAYMEIDRNTGEARLIRQEIGTGIKAILGTLPIPKGSGSSLPQSANLSWSGDGKFLVFDFGRGATDRAIYLAYADGPGLVKVTDSGHAPAISADGKCLAYISDKQVLLMDMNDISSTEGTATSLILANLPVGRGVADYRLDKLGWRPD